MRWLLLALAACSGASSAPPPTTPAEPVAAATVPAESAVAATVPADTAVADTAEADPASVAAAPLPAAPAPAPGGEVWRFRALKVGLISPQSELTRYTLSLRGSEATMVVEQQLLRGSRADVVGGAWQTSRTETLRGTARQKGAALELELTGSGKVHALGCKRTRSKVAVAQAVRIPDPASDQECGNQGTWSPAKKVSKELLLCEGGQLGRLELGRGAGLELLSVNDDCIMQGRGVREVAEDGAIAPPRAPEGPG